MKVNTKKVMMAISLIGVFTMGIVSTANAKFWGWKVTSTVDWADGECAYRQTCRIHYILWFAGEEQCTTSTIDCLDD